MRQLIMVCGSAIVESVFENALLQAYGPDHVSPQRMVSKMLNGDPTNSFSKSCEALLYPFKIILLLGLGLLFLRVASS